jgi:hypothetical protein
MDKVISFLIVFVTGVSLILGLMAIEAANDGRVRTAVNQLVTK